ncbi:vWA domain-containing protein [Streptomyces sp. CA-111067]|uniref:vWA domain-containing protein n=1 Tax=Streptomyces sp. CA-111067 TaxID=3240046 RepID=UPI003D954635
MRRSGQVVLVGDSPPLGLVFSVDVDAPSDLAFNDDRADALLTIRARSAGSAPYGATAAEVLIMDRSLSMVSQGKLNEAKRAMCAAVDSLRDGTYLGIVAGHHEAEVIYPATGGLARVDAEARAAAKNRIMNQLPEGGTAIGTWLTCADRLFASVAARDCVRHAVLYTDGKDEHETPEELGEALAACADHFVCDARGLGDDWHFPELLRITEALHGDARAVVTTSELTQDFTRLMENARRMVVPRVYLGLDLSDKFRLDFVRQALPLEADLTAQQQRHDGDIHIPLGAWSPEERQYHLSLRFDPEKLPVEDEVRAARITLRAERPDATREPCADTEALLIRRRATPDFATSQPASLTRAENIHDLAIAMRACATAAQEGRWGEADQELLIALNLAVVLRDDERLALLRDCSTTGPDGRPQVQRGLSSGKIQSLGLESARTGSVNAASVHAPAPDGAPQRRECPVCHAVTHAPQVRVCEECGHRFDGPTDDVPADVR